MIVMGKQVTLELGSFDIDANILDSKIELTAFLPTTISEYRIIKPYRVSIPTKYGRITRFARDFSIELANERYFDIFTRACLNLWEDLPRWGVMTQCGETIFLSRTDFLRIYTEIINYVLLNTELWAPQLGSGPDEPLTFAIEKANGNTYEDLYVRFKMPDDFEPAVPNYIFDMSIQKTLASVYAPFLSTQDCMKPYKWDYTMFYPIVVKVKDDLLNPTNYFYFTTFVYVDEMQNGECDAQVTGVGALAQCENPQCEIQLAVREIRDGMEQPLEGAIVRYGGCEVNVSDSNGLVKGKIPCTVTDPYLLEIIHPDTEYFPYVNEHSSYSISPSKRPTIVLHKLKEHNFRFLEDPGVAVDEERVIISLVSQDSGQTYTVSNEDTLAGYDECMDIHGQQCGACAADSENQAACDSCFAAQSLCSAGSITSTVAVDYVPGGRYTASAIIVNTQILPTTDRPYYGFPIQTKEATFTLPEETSLVTFRVPDSRDMYNTAQEKRDDRYDSCCDDYYCSCTVHPISCDGHKDECDAKGIQKGIEYVSALQKLVVTVS